MRRVRNSGHNPSRFVFVTSRPVRGVDRDSIGREAMELYNWDLTIYSREWLRLQLEEASPDLAHKHLGVEMAPGKLQLSYPQLDDEEPSLSSINLLMKNGSFERAGADLLDLIAREPRIPAAWEALSWAQYQTYRYDDAMASINRAIEISDSARSQSIRACILAERGIQRDDRASLIEARDIFRILLKDAEPTSWLEAYNLGNVLSALGHNDEAIETYEAASALAPQEVMIWKNLASACHRAGKHDREMQCLDKALDLDPLKPEALASKGVCLLVNLDRPVEASSYLEKALSVSDDWPVRWPQIWYWLAKASMACGQNQAALKHSDAGLRHHPGHAGLRRLKSQLLERLLESDDEQYRACAESFWAAGVELEPLDFSVRRSLVRLLTRQGREENAWRLLNQCFALFGMAEALTPSSRSRHCLFITAIATIAQ